MELGRGFGIGESFSIRRQTKSRTGQVADRIHQKQLYQGWGSLAVATNDQQYQSIIPVARSSSSKTNLQYWHFLTKDKPFHGRPVASKFDDPLMGGIDWSGGGRVIHYHHRQGQRHFFTTAQWGTSTLHTSGRRLELLSCSSHMVSIEIASVEHNRSSIQYGLYRALSWLWKTECGTWWK
jgi:hypothetical protein